MTPDLCKAHKRMTVPAVVCIRNYSKQINFTCCIHHSPSNEMSANPYFMPRAMSICMCIVSKCIILRVVGQTTDGLFLIANIYLCYRRLAFV